ncbi:MAG: hypothetical protein KBT27_03520 [Prevotellaceae bacterium]|nr:hypothetical protein [Candidatus Faecinaster equi]
MSKLKWDEVGSRLYETGIDRVVLYPQSTDGKYPKGVAWNGVSSISESPSGAEANDIYADNQKYLSLLSKETFSETLEAYMYPDEWEPCDGSLSPVKGVRIYQQARQSFGLCYRTIIGNDTAGEAYGYKLHLVYNCKATPSERSYSTTSESPEAATFSYSISTTAIEVENYKPTSLITIDSTDYLKEDGGYEDAFIALEDVLYGTDSKEATLPSPEDVFKILKGETVENGAG